jgi:hypothetical protein
MHWRVPIQSWVNTNGIAPMRTNQSSRDGKLR